MEFKGLEKTIRPKPSEVRDFIIEQASKSSKGLAKVVSENFKISRQAVNKHISKLVAEGILVSKGITNKREYHLVTLKKITQTYSIDSELSESEIWRNDLSKFLAPLNENSLGIWQYAINEMINNVIDHSEGKFLSVEIESNAFDTVVYIYDDGVGIFRKIKDFLQLADERHAVLELAKGKFTTDPSKHSGQGIFFSSRVMDDFVILSGSTFFSHKYDDLDWIVERENAARGTTVQMRLSNQTTRTLKSIFDKFTTSEDYAFDKTIVPVKLTKYGDENLVSRSQAKRLLTRFDKFKTVILDFTDVNSIGQAFADEIFRVFHVDNPSVALVEIHANEEVKQMIQRAKNSSV